MGNEGLHYAEKILFYSLSLKMKIIKTASKGCFKDLMSWAM